MRRLNKFFLLILCLPAIAQDNYKPKKIFTATLELNSGELLIAGFVKGFTNGDSKLVAYNFKDGKKKVAVLPKKYNNRAVMAVAPHEKDGVFFVVTQTQRGDVDDPRLHLWEMKANKWEDLQSLNCKYFRKVQIIKGEIQLECHSDSEFDKKGNPKVEMKSFLHKDIREPQPVLVEKAQVVGGLEDQLTVSIKGQAKEVLLNSNDLL